MEQVRLAGFEHALSFTAAEGKIYFRSYKQVLLFLKYITKFGLLLIIHLSIPQDSDEEEWY